MGRNPSPLPGGGLRLAREAEGKGGGMQEASGLSWMRNARPGWRRCQSGPGPA